MKNARLEAAIRLAQQQIAAGRAMVDRWRIEQKVQAAMTPYRKSVPERVRLECAYLRAQIVDGPSYDTWPGLAYAVRELGVRSGNGKCLGGF